MSTRKEFHSLRNQILFSLVAFFFISEWNTEQICEQYILHLQQSYHLHDSSVHRARAWTKKEKKVAEAQRICIKVKQDY